MLNYDEGIDGSMVFTFALNILDLLALFIFPSFVCFLQCVCVCADD